MPKIDILKNDIPCEKTSQMLLTIGRPVVAMAMIGQWEKRVPYIHSVFVGRRHRRKGYGRSLIRKAARMASDAGKPAINIWVDKKNKVAIALYSDEGFVVTGNDNPAMMTLVLSKT